MYKRIFFLSFAFLSLCFLSSAQSNKPRTAFTVWDEFVKLSNSGADHATSVQTYFKACIKENVPPEEFYNVHIIGELETSERKFRESADKLHELRMRLEHPLPKGIQEAKK
jgi:hypothetical protein